MNGLYFSKPSRTSKPDFDNPAGYVSLSAASGEWNSMEIDSRTDQKSEMAYDSLPSRYSKSYDHKLVITDKKHFKSFVYVLVSLVLLIITMVLLFHFLPHKKTHHGSSKNLTQAVNQALMFFDAQKSGNYPNDSPVTFRGPSGLQDGNDTDVLGGLVGGFYDSGINMKFTFSTAYTVTLLSWTVIEYHDKYSGIGQLEHVKDIIRWGSNYLLKVLVAPNSTVPFTLYSQVGSSRNDTEADNDRCWQRPEDMNYIRPVMKCDGSASDLAGEIMAALSAASLALADNDEYSLQLSSAAETIFNAVNNTGARQGTYTENPACGGEASMYYNSSGYRDELVWGGTWLFFATGNISYLDYVSTAFNASVAEEAIADQGVFYWNNKLRAAAVLLTRIRYFHDFGYPYETTLGPSKTMTDTLICSYLSPDKFNMTPGGLILLKPESGQPLQYAATASFLVKLYSDYLQLLQSNSISCQSDGFLIKDLHSFSWSQVSYILGDNPMKTSYVVGFGSRYPTHVHHRAASIPWDGQHYTCVDGANWLMSPKENPNTLYGAMVAGPDRYDKFVDDRNEPGFTEPSIASNAGLVAALISLHDPPQNRPGSNENSLGIDLSGIFGKIRSSS